MIRTTHRLLSGALLFVLLSLALLLAGCSGPEVPDITGMSQIDAVRALEDAGYALGDVHSVFSNQVPVGFVVSTDPPAGTRAKEGTKVSVSVNSGTSASITVPGLVGQGQSAAEDNLTRIDLVPVVSESYSPTVSAGQVMAQVPEPGSKVVAGANVVIQVSKGVAPTTVAVPAVTGKTQAAAESALKGAGLTVKVYSVYSDTVAKGNVIAQAPSAGSKVTVGSEAAIAVSLGKGVGAVTVPNVMGKAEADAVKAMQSAGLKVKVYRQNSDTVAKGVVGAQVPTGGTTTASGAEVAIVVSLGPATESGDGSLNVAVPDVVGMTQAEATTALTAEGFLVQVVEQAGSATVGSVVAQLPGVGSTAPAGSTVVIAVSTGP